MQKSFAVDILFSHVSYLEYISFNTKASKMLFSGNSGFLAMWRCSTLACVSQALLDYSIQILKKTLQSGAIPDTIGVVQPYYAQELPC